MPAKNTTTTAVADVVVVVIVVVAVVVGAAVEMVLRCKLLYRHIRRSVRAIALIGAADMIDAAVVAKNCFVLIEAAGRTGRTGRPGRRAVSHPRPGRDFGRDPDPGSGFGAAAFHHHIALAMVCDPDSLTAGHPMVAAESRRPEALASSFHRPDLCCRRCRWPLRPSNRAVKSLLGSTTRIVLASPPLAAETPARRSSSC